MHTLFFDFSGSMMPLLEAEKYPKTVCGLFFKHPVSTKKMGLGLSQAQVKLEAIVEVVVEARS